MLSDAIDERRGRSANASTTAIVTAVIFGFLGYFLRKRNFDLGLLILSYVLGPILERSVRQALTISGGEASIFYSTPLSAGLLAFAAMFLLLGLLQSRTLSLREDG